MPAAIALALVVPSTVPVSFSGPGRLLRDYLLCLILGIAIGCFKGMRSGRLTSSAGTVAKYSYGIYLLHMPLLWLSFVYAAPSLSLSLQFCLFSALCTALPWLAFRWIRATDDRFRTPDRRQSFQTAGGLRSCLETDCVAASGGLTTQVLRVQPETITIPMQNGHIRDENKPET